MRSVPTVRETEALHPRAASWPGAPRVRSAGSLRAPYSKKDRVSPGLAAPEPADPARIASLGGTLIPIPPSTPPPCAVSATSPTTSLLPGILGLCYGLVAESYGLGDRRLDGGDQACLCFPTQRRLNPQCQRIGCQPSCRSGQAEIKARQRQAIQRKQQEELAS